MPPLALLVAGAVAYARHEGASLTALAAVITLAVIPASELAIGWVQRTVLTLLGPKRLPRLDFSTGIPEQALWIEGAPHVLSLPNAPERLAANTLIWTQDNRTLRLEGAESLDEAVEIAQSFR